MRLLITALFLLALSLAPEARAAIPQRIVATTFPVYQLVRNVARNVPDREVMLMLPAQAGCPHDYALTPQDVNKAASADILVVNGQGLETFLGSLSGLTKKHMRLVDASRDIPDLIAYADAEKDEHDHGGTNPHLFASPRMAAAMTLSIGRQLAKADPANADAYRANAEAYARRLDALADDFAALGKRLKNTRIVTQHGVFDYLARDMGLSVVGVVQAHDTQAPSAADMMRLIKGIHEQKAGAIFTEPQYPDKIGATLSRETGVPTATLDPVATGPLSAPLDYYETVMRENLRTLEATLGTE